jgi:hypothetical protein
VDPKYSIVDLKKKVVRVVQKHYSFNNINCNVTLLEQLLSNTMDRRCVRLYLLPCPISSKFQEKKSTIGHVGPTFRKTDSMISLKKNC